MKNFFYLLTLCFLTSTLIAWSLWREARSPLNLSSPDEVVELVLSEDFENSSALKHFLIATPDLGFTAGQDGVDPWRIDGGELIAKNVHNAALWLKTPLPEGDLRITFTARALSSEGDVKCEIFGDGQHHQSGYILINGGWKNTIRAIARQDEHGEDRKEDRRCGQQRNCAPLNTFVEWTIERRGETIRWYLDGELTLSYHDSKPLRGRYFAFNNWSVETRFDQLRVYRIKRSQE